MNSGSCQQIELNSSIYHKPEGEEVVPAKITQSESVVQINKVSGEPSSKMRHLSEV